MAPRSLSYPNVFQSEQKDFWNSKFFSDDHLYICGGAFVAGVDQLCERFSFQTHKWEMTQMSLPCLYDSAFAVAHGPFLFILGGYDLMGRCTGEKQVMNATFRERFHTVQVRFSWPI